MPKPIPDRRSPGVIAAVAHHEAGHAVANFFHQVHFLWVTIERGKGSDGRVHLRKNRLRLNRHLAEREAVCLLADPRHNAASTRAASAATMPEVITSRL